MGLDDRHRPGRHSLSCAPRRKCDLPDRTGYRNLAYVAGTGEQGYSGDGGPARSARLGGPKGLAFARGNLYVADTENHVVRRIELQTGIITTVLGTGQRGDGPEPSASLRARQPHGVFVDAAGTLYVGDSEATAFAS